MVLGPSSFSSVVVSAYARGLQEARSCELWKEADVARRGVRAALHGAVRAAFPKAADEVTEEIRFQCPACGGSFAVSSWYSERIFCGPCRRNENSHSGAQ